MLAVTFSVIFDAFSCKKSERSFLVVIVFMPLTATVR